MNWHFKRYAKEQSPGQRSRDERADCEARAKNVELWLTLSWHHPGSGVSAHNTLRPFPDAVTKTGDHFPAGSRWPTAVDPLRGARRINVDYLHIS